LPDLVIGSDTGTLTFDNLTSDTTPTFSGTADPPTKQNDGDRRFGGHGLDRVLSETVV
jgi:Bacterial Ig-like domain